MEHRMHPHSIEAHASLLDDLPKRRRFVLRAIQEHPGSTRNDLADIYHVPLATICGRVRELIDMGLVRERGIKVHGKRARARLEIVPPAEFSPPAGRRAPKGWFPIESAPRNCAVLLAGGHYAPAYVGAHRAGREHEHHPGDHHWRCAVTGRLVAPTHWHPLPDFPKN